MKYRFLLVLCILTLLAAAPVSADLQKVKNGATVFVGETGLDISSALNGCRQIAWWTPGNTTDSPPTVILNFSEAQITKYNISPDIFATHTGTWYRYYPSPRIPIFVVEKPRFDLSVWDLDHGKDVTGQTVPRSTNVTYRIDTNLYKVFDSLQRPDSNPHDTFIGVTLTGPGGNPINSVYTASVGSKGFTLLPMDMTPVVKASPYYWKYGGQWNHSAKGYDGTVLYPLGTYTFSATQNLDNMQFYYGASDTVVATGPKTVTFVADQGTTAPAGTTAGVVSSGTTVPEPSGAATTKTTGGAIPSRTSAPVTTVKATWTSSPLSMEVPLAALGLAAVLFFVTSRRGR